MNYLSQDTPKEYKCSVCDATKCKLWRYSNTFDTSLFCCDCASEESDINITKISRTGQIFGEFGYTDQIGNYVPAVPSDVGYYWYTAIPNIAYLWWKNLPQ